MRIIAITILLVLLTACVDRGPSEGDYPIRTVTVNGQEKAYRVFLPQNRDPNKKVPVMLYLHGSGSRGEENRENAWAFDATVAKVRDRIDFIAVLPQCPTNSFWSHKDVAAHALAALQKSIEEFNGDPQRIYLAGFSLGGYGVWHIASANPGKFAALVPIAGGVVGDRPIDPRDRAVIIPEAGTLLDSPEPYKAIAGAIGQTPVWVFHGANDDLVPADFSRRIVQALDESGNKNVRYTEYPEEGHLIVGKVFEEPGFFDWLGERKVQPPSR